MIIVIDKKQNAAISSTRLSNDRNWTGLSIERIRFKRNRTLKLKCHFEKIKNVIFKIMELFFLCILKLSIFFEQFL